MQITHAKDLPFITYFQWLGKQDPREIELDQNIYRGMTGEEIINLEIVKEFDYFVSGPVFSLDGMTHQVATVDLGATVQEVNTNLRGFFHRTTGKRVLYQIRQRVNEQFGELPGIRFVARMAVIR